MRVLIVSPYHGGSHRVWGEGYREHSRHDVVLMTLPARFWKWRMHGGAITLARRFNELTLVPDLLVATDMLDLTTFLALTRDRTPRLPVVLYMHENQLTYPLPDGGESGAMRRQQGERDLHYAFINFASMMAADAVIFNSHYHLASFFDALPAFLKHFPENNELDSVELLKTRSHVLPVGIDLRRLDAQSEVDRPAAPPLILWNHRWEYDKNPADFFSALYQLEAEGIPFHLALCGKNFRRSPGEFLEVKGKLGGRITHFGFASEERYRQLLWQATITVSTAVHEFFGISMLEAIYCHTFPILPFRLSYPELIPNQFHEACLYRDPDGLHRQLNWALTHPDEGVAIAAALARSVSAFDWTHIAPAYDRMLHQIATWR